MRLKYVNGANRTWFEREICEDYGPVEFDDDGVANVKADVGKAMCEAYPDAFSVVKKSAKQTSEKE